MISKVVRRCRVETFEVKPFKKQVGDRPNQEGSPVDHAFRFPSRSPFGNTAVVRPSCGYPRGLLIGLTKYSLPNSNIPDLPIARMLSTKNAWSNEKCTQLGDKTSATSL